MSKVFNKAFDKLMELEGGYSNHKNDRGRKTKYGITEATARAAGYQGDMKKLTLNEAKSIYYKSFWLANNYDKIKCQDIAVEMLEQAALMGPETANNNLQRSYNLVSDEEITVDGIIGSETLAAVNSSPYPHYIYKLLNIYQGKKIISITEQDPTQKVFIRGWLKRITLRKE